VGVGSAIAWSGVTATRLVDPLLIQRVLKYRAHKNLETSHFDFQYNMHERGCPDFWGKHRIGLLAQREGGLCVGG
jgi:hypothetical protein